jgi:hypothetical protein
MIRMLSAPPPVGEEQLALMLAIVGLCCLAIGYLIGKNS